MGKTSIEWTDASWNPVVGCTEVSPGCANCYAARLAATRLRHTSQYKNLARNSAQAGPRWTAQVRFLPDRLEEPLHWRKPRRIFVCDMGDLFHESVPDEFLASVFRIMSRASHHTFQVLTKRAARMKQFVSSVKEWEGFHTHNGEPPKGYGGHGQIVGSQWPLPNVWLGVSVENQHFAEERIPLLLGTPAVVRFLSCEPLLSDLNLRMWVNPNRMPMYTVRWVIAGGESGLNARPMQPDWVRSLRDQCIAAAVPFFFKQWGEWAPLTDAEYKILMNTEEHKIPLRVRHTSYLQNGQTICWERIGKKKAGRLLDGREWNEFPVTA